MAGTIKDLAQETGLGLATISSYLNGGNVREKNRVKIEAAIEKYNFRINEMARSLKTNRTKTVGVVIPELSSNFFAKIIMQLEDLLRQHGYATIVCDSRSDPIRQQEAMEFLFSKRVDAVVNAPINHNNDHLKLFLQAQKPVVLIDRKIVSNQCDNVLIDNVDAIRSAVSLLVRGGHQKIGFVSGPEYVFTAAERVTGYRLAMLEAGLPVEDRFIVPTDYSIQSGKEAMSQLLQRNPDMTAVVATNDAITVGAMIAINEYGVSVPNQLSVIGFDDEDFARACHPGLTIMAQPLREIADKTVEILLTRLEGRGDLPAQEIRFQAKMITGKSIQNLI